MRKIKAAVIGAGFIGAAHVEALKRLHNVEIAAICDAEDIIKEKAARLGIEKYYRSYQELLGDSSIDCVHICTPNHLHFQMSMAALKAGKHVVCEKPLTTERGEAEELVAVAGEKGLVNAINFSLRYYPIVRHLKIMIQNGELGDVFSINGSYLQDWLLYETDYNWRLEPHMAGRSRAVADIGSHWMDMAEYVTGIKILEVMSDFATFHKIRKKPLKPVETYSGKLLAPEDYKDIPINTEDYAGVLLRLENGAHGSVAVSQTAAGRKNRLYIEIHGSKKTAAWDSEKPNEIWIGKRDGGNEIILKDPALLYPEARELSSYPGGHNEGFPDTFKQHFKEIYSCISERKAGSSAGFPSFMDGFRELKLCEAIIESNEKRAWVEVR